MKPFVRSSFLILLSVALACAQQSSASSKPTEHILGTVTKIDPASHSVTVKDDKSAKEYPVLLENTKTLLKVTPGAKDLTGAIRITADDLQTGDRVDVRGVISETNPNAIAARSVVLMSGRDLAEKHQEEAAAWQHSLAGSVNSVDAAGQKLEVNVRTPEGVRPMIVTVSKSTSFTRYSPDTPKTPVPSDLAAIQPGDQVRIIGEKSEDGSAIAAQRIYSGAFRTLAGTVTAIAPGGRQLTIKDLQTKQPVEVVLADGSTVRKLPPMMAAALARRLNPNSGSAQGGAAAAPPSPPARAGSGDLSRMLERVPAISVSDLKPGDAVIVSGAASGPDKSRLLASSIIAGVEPIFQSAPPRQGQSLGDWSLDMQAPAQQ